MWVVQILREGIGVHGGYEINTEGDAFHIAFPRVAEAILFCLDAQYTLLDVKWPKELLRLSSCKEEWDGHGDPVFRGLRVRMCIHYARPGTLAHRCTLLHDDGVRRISASVSGRSVSVLPRRCTADTRVSGLLPLLCILCNPCYLTHLLILTSFACRSCVMGVRMTQFLKGKRLLPFQGSVLRVAWKLSPCHISLAHIFVCNFRVNTIFVSTWCKKNEAFDKTSRACWFPLTQPCSPCNLPRVGCCGAPPSKSQN